MSIKTVLLSFFTYRVKIANERVLKLLISHKEVVKSFQISETVIMSTTNPIHSPMALMLKF